MDEIPEGLPSYFEPIKRLGEGGMGIVWSARDKRVDRVGALKVVRRKTGMSPVTITRFEREIRNFAQLVHPYIVQVYDVGKLTTGEPYIFMEQVDGTPLCAEVLKGHSFSEIMRLIDRILEGLSVAHAHNLIHRDLKPDNILIVEDENGQLMPKLMDFGLALCANENDVRITTDGMVVGTPIYMAPEQACDEHYQICPATDFYSIGCILYELFCGEPPFTGNNAVMIMVAQAKDDPRPFHPLPEFAEAMRMASIMNKLFDKMPDHRYELAADFRAALRRSFLVRDGRIFGVAALKNGTNTRIETDYPDNDTDDSPQPAPITYHTILPDTLHANYNYSIISLRAPVFVGRGSAKRELERYLIELYACKRSAVTLITGRPGIGKTRFLESFAQDCYRLGTATTLVVDGALCSSLRFAIFRALFARLLMKTLTDQQMVLALCRFLHTDDENDPRVLLLLAMFKNELAQREAHEDQMKSVFCDIFTRLTQSRPLILCFDNIKNVQRSELCALLQELSTGPIGSLPILICVVNTAFNDLPTDIELTLAKERSIWLRRGITLQPLSHTDIHTLTCGSLGIDEKLALFIDNISSGVPQIAVDLARQWHKNGYLTPSAHGYKSLQPLSELPIPRSVHEAIMRRITMTFAAYSHHTWYPIAALAAICGSSFSPKLISLALDFLPANHQLLSPHTFISLALANGVLKTLDEKTLAFDNALMQSALIAMLQDYEIRDYHRAIAAARKTFPSSLENDCEIAEHLTLAGQFDDAFHAYLNLTNQYILVGNYERARNAIEKTKDALIQQHGFIGIHTPYIADVWFAEAKINFDTNHLGEAAQHVQWLSFACQNDTRPECKIYYSILQSRLLHTKGEHEKADAFQKDAENCIAALPHPLSDEHLKLKFQVLTAKLQFHSDDTQELVETAKKLNHFAYLGKAFLALAHSAIESGNLSNATRILNTAIHFALQCGDAHTEAYALLALAKIQDKNSDVRLKTLYDASLCFEKLADFHELARIHAEIARLLAKTSPNESRLHAQWSYILTPSKN